MSADAPQRFVLDRLRTPIGDMLIGVDERERLRIADFADYEPRMRTLLRQQYAARGGAELSQGRAPKAIRDALTAYFSGELKAIDSIGIETGGTDFQRRLWRALREIPPGRTTTYGALAARLGAPQAVRAIGAANGANPISVILPCHRVIGANGRLTGYGGGLHRKRWLLTHEGAAFRDE
jgi:methylated-DNA-[protein]-cysteine S-methyltransferase